MPFNSPESGEADGLARIGRGNMQKRKLKP